jgi:hypothetical protein
MAPDQIFSIANLVAAACWLLLVLLPGKRWVADTIAGATVPAMFAAAYILIVLMYFGGAQGGFSSLADVALLFGNPWMLVAGWMHYLAFDLLVGAWQVRDARGRAIPHLLVVPCLVLTFLFGPAGWLLYMAVRTAFPRAAPLRPPQLAESKG